MVSNWPSNNGDGDGESGIRAGNMHKPLEHSDDDDDDDDGDDGDGDNSIILYYY